MDENRGRSTVLVLMMGIAIVGAILYAFVIGPNSNRQTLGSSNLVLEIPVQKWNFRGGEDAIVPFCQDNNNALTFRVAENIPIMSATDGVVVNIEDKTITIEAMTNVLIEYYPFTNFNVLVGDFVPLNTTLGRISGDEFNIRVNNTRSSIYECPYIYLNSFGKDVVDEVLNNGNKACECALLKY